jgi:hypothetical protein
MSEYVGDFIPTRVRHRHDCSEHLPAAVPFAINEGDLWRCPTCHRRWRLVHRHEPPTDGRPRIGLAYPEGIAITGPDGSQYWRPFRLRFIGRMGA